MHMLLAVVMAASPVTVEMFTDKGDTFIRSGAQNGIRVGQALRVLGEEIADTKERRTVGTLTVLEVWDSLARVSLDTAARELQPGPLVLDIPRSFTSEAFERPVRVVRGPKPPRNPWIAHAIIGGSGAALFWLVTLLVDVTVGDASPYTNIPIVGPFVTIAYIDSSPNLYLRDGFRGLLIASGAVQAAFFAYMVTGLVGIATWRPPLVAITPSSGGGATVNVGFAW